MSFREHGNSLEKFYVVTTGPNQYISTRQTYGNVPRDSPGRQPVFHSQRDPEGGFPGGACLKSRIAVKILDRNRADIDAGNGNERVAKLLLFSIFLFSRPVDPR
jgi:hypothetical protein